MKATELRIGNIIEVFCKKDNYFYDKDGWNEIKVSGINSNEVSFIEPDIATFNFFKFVSEIDAAEKFTRGVAITSERLVNLGGELNENGYFIFSNVKVFAVGKNRIEFVFKGTNGLMFSTELDYVHQLQNLYFSLTGKELKLMP